MVAFEDDEQPVTSSCQGRLVPAVSPFQPQRHVFAAAAAPGNAWPQAEPCALTAKVSEISRNVVWSHRKQGQFRLVEAHGGNRLCKIPQAFAWFVEAHSGNSLC